MQKLANIFIISATWRKYVLKPLVVKTLSLQLRTAIGSVKGIVPVLPHQKSDPARSHLGEKFNQNPLSWTLLSFHLLFCYEKYLNKGFKAISHLFRLSEMLWHVKGQFAFKTINLLPTSRRGGRILGGGTTLFSKNTCIHTLKHLISSVF